jgi:RNA polymerase sigma-70 factor (ECF subfamily)
MPQINTSKLSDEAVVELVRKNDQELYSVLIKRYQKKLLRYANYLINDEDLAADSVEEAFIKAFINLNSFKTNMKFSSWLYRIVHNQAINLIQKNKLHQSTEQILELASPLDLEAEMISKEEIKRAKKCLQKIPLLYREPLSLFYLEEKSYEEISDILRLPISSVGTRIRRAKILIKKICQNN